MDNRRGGRIVLVGLMAVTLVIAIATWAAPPGAYGGGTVRAVCGPGRYLQKVFTDVTGTTDILYSTVDDIYGTHQLHLDVYEPAGDMLAARPTIVWVHGGSFKTGTKTQLAFFAREYALRGYVSVAISYRLLRAFDPNVTLPVAAAAAQSDAQAAIRYLRLNTARWRLDPARFAIAGYSAGSITSFYVGYRYEFLGDNRSNYPGPSHRVSLVYSIDGIPDVVDEVVAGDPPFVISRSGIGGNDGDPVVLHRLRARTDELGIASEVHIIQGAQHADMIVPPYNAQIVALATQFTCDHLVTA